MRENIIKAAKRVIIKVGTSLLVKDNKLQTYFITHLAQQIVQLRAQGKECVVVTSGAVGLGAELNQKRKTLNRTEQQALAAIGQSRLMQAYDHIFAQNDLMTAQMLVTRDDIQNRHNYVSIANTLKQLINWNITPIINENNAISIEATAIGDNDTLAALIASQAQADLLVLLTSVDGLIDYKNNQVIEVVTNIDKEASELVRQEKTSLGTGGMATKLQAARIVNESGIAMLIANGKQPHVMTDLLQGINIGTLFCPRKKSLYGKKSWIAFGADCKGEIHIDRGAQAAVCQRGKSLLASGVTQVVQNFSRGDTVALFCEGQMIARGIVHYSSSELEQVRGCQVSQIDERFSGELPAEVIHRDNLALL
ncbi:glutamate 5-kinase [Piscirickettsia litoralis]|uniref:Glutamate 5-kinase n=1 Tax=Piscirickettsia litoralis TaxID=1891921 RepID=A0ABX3A3T6_9GAMM|nr:glutamate 5-kinase [Piscirickettsia litoralis]ODN43516.1 glutamate 5-kinase [Piscirickettsia litoralis]